MKREEQWKELHMNGAENSQKWRYRNLLNELKVLFHLSWPICFFLLGADFVSAGGQYFLWPFKHSHLCCICCSSVINEHLRHCFHYRNKHRRRHTVCPILWRITLQGNGVHPSKSYANLHSLYISLRRCIHSWRSYSNALFCWFIHCRYCWDLLEAERIWASYWILVGSFWKIYSVSGKVIPSFIANIISNIVNALLCYAFIFGCDWCVVGAAIAICFSMTVLAVVYFLMIILLKLHKRTWPDWHWSSVHGWGQYVKLAIPGTVMIVSEWYLMPQVSELATFSGPEDLQTVRRTTLAALLLSISIITIVLIITLAFRTKQAYIIISDNEVATHISRLVPYLIWCALTDCVATVNLGILSG